MDHPRGIRVGGFHLCAGYFSSHRQTLSHGQTLSQTHYSYSHISVLPCNLTLFVSSLAAGRPETYVEVLEAAGFVDVEWFGMTVPPQFVFNREALEHLMARINPAPVVGLKARRP